MDQGVIASMMSHPLEGAIVLLDPEGHPLAANATARTLDLPRGLQLHRLALLGLRDRVADQGLLPCSVPVGEQRMDGFLSAARAGRYGLRVHLQCRPGRLAGGRALAAAAA